LINLKTLYAGCRCGLDNTGISSLTNLTNLQIDYNDKITDINFSINLRTLNACGCKINNISIASLTNLRMLLINDASTINIELLTQLKKLVIVNNNKKIEI
jgi:hypothetical protein